MKVLVIGLGAAGTRHQKILNDLGHQVFTVSSHTLQSEFNYHSMAKALDMVKPNYVVICNETSEHLDTLKELQKLKYTGTVLIEKPLDFNHQKDYFEFERIGVGYNLRFLSSIVKLKKEIAQDKFKIYSAEIYYGNLYSNWRDEKRNLAQYSSLKKKGGGVLRDFSHELDLLIWLFGEPKVSYAVGGKIGEVTIDSDDCWHVSMNTSQVPIISLQLNSLDTMPKREIRILTSAGTIWVDLLKNKLISFGIQVDCEGSIDDTYGLMHAALISRQGESVATIEEALKVDELIYKIESMSHGA
jgi:predicted dehydrogenase